jgi:hypothetical protein
LAPAELYDLQLILLLDFLHHIPEVFDSSFFLVKTSCVFCVFSQQVNINFGTTTYHEF